MVAVTADVIAVDLIANDARYVKGMGNAKRAFLDFSAANTNGMEKLERSTVRGMAKAGASTDVMAGALRRLLPLMSAAAIISFGNSLMATADRLKDTSDQLGITTADLQAYEYAARMSGSSSEKMGQALAILTDQLGDAQRGNGELAKMMRELNIPLGTTNEVFRDLADAIQKAETQQEKMRIATTAFSRAGRTMVPMLQEGAAGLAKWREEAQKKGQIWDDATLAKLDRAKDSIENLKVKMTGMLANPFADAIDGVTDFIRFLTEADRLWAILQGNFKINPISEWGLQGQSKTLRWSPPSEWGLPQSRRQVPLSSEQQDKQRKDAQALEDQTAATAKDLADLNARLQSDVFAAKNEMNEANRESIKAQTDALLQLSAGTEDYYTVLRASIEEAAKLDLVSIQDRLVADLRALEDRKNQNLAALDAMKLDDKQKAVERVKIQAAYYDQQNSLQNAAADRERAVNAQKNADLEAADEASIQRKQRLIALNTGIRNGLEEIGLASLRGFGDMKDAAGRALEQVADLIYQLYVLKPLLDSLMGPSGTIGDGMFSGGPGGLFASLGNGIANMFGMGNLAMNTASAIAANPLLFDSGGRTPVNQPVMVGGRGKELWVPDAPGRVIPNHALPDMPRRGAGATPSVQRVEFNIHVTGTTDAEIMQQVRVAVAEGISQYDRGALPSRVNELTNDPRLR